MPSLEQQFADHERKDAERFELLHQEIKDFRAEMKPVLEVYTGAMSMRKGIVWIATFMGAVATIVYFFSRTFK